LENEKVPSSCTQTQEQDSIPWNNLTHLIESSSSDASLIKHQPGFAGKKTRLFLNQDNDESVVEFKVFLKQQGMWVY